MSTQKGEGLFVRGSWANQEFLKGTDLIAENLQSFEQAGWGFNNNYVLYENPNTHVLEPYPPMSTSAIPDYMLRSTPFFRKFRNTNLLTDKYGSSLAANSMIKYEVLAAGIPAMSFAVAVNSMPAFNSNNINMESLKSWVDQWPTEDHTSTLSAGRWLHSDSKQVAINFMWKMYKKMIDLGGLNQ